jgi:hypothetical protein
MKVAIQSCSRLKVAGCCKVASRHNTLIYRVNSCNFNIAAKVPLQLVPFRGPNCNLRVREKKTE